MISTAVILAAGRGTRLAGELRDRPKGFLILGERPIIEESIDRLTTAGVRDVIIVTGHCAEYYEELARRRRDVVRTIHNPRYAETGSLYSLWCARDAARGPLLLLESDLVYEPRALSVLLESPAPDAVLLSGPTRAGDEVYVETREGRLVRMSKRRDELGPEVAGELVGISKISAELFLLMQRISEGLFASTLKLDYETDCLVAAARERPIHCPVVPDLLWGEIDDPSHLARVRDHIYTQVCARSAATLKGDR